MQDEKKYVLTLDFPSGNKIYKGTLQEVFSQLGEFIKGEVKKRNSVVAFTSGYSPTYDQMFMSYLEDSNQIVGEQYWRFYSDRVTFNTPEEYEQKFAQKKKSQECWLSLKGGDFSISNKVEHSFDSSNYELSYCDDQEQNILLNKYLEGLYSSGYNDVTITDGDIYLFLVDWLSKNEIEHPDYDAEDHMLNTLYASYNDGLRDGGHKYNTLYATQED